jgi:uncharacterized protein YegL
MSTSTCHRCGSVGHFAKECTQLKKCYDCHLMVSDIVAHKSVCVVTRKTHVGGTVATGSVRSGLKQCYDCHEMVPDVRAHRAVCSVSKKSKSIITTPASGVPMVLPVLSTPVSVIKATSTDVYFLLDVSGSMTGYKLDTAKSSVTDLVKSIKPLDRMAIVTFDDSPYFKLKPRPVEEILRKNELPSILDRIFAKGMTAIYDAIHLSVSQLRDKTQSTVMIVLTDGDDNSSKHSYQEVLEMLKEYPNIVLNIIHIDGVSKPNLNYQTMCVNNRGTYKTIVETEIEITIKTIFKTYYRV